MNNLTAKNDNKSRINSKQPKMKNSAQGGEVDKESAWS